MSRIPGSRFSGVVHQQCRFDVYLLWLVEPAALYHIDSCGDHESCLEEAGGLHAIDAKCGGTGASGRYGIGACAWAECVVCGG